MGVVGFNTIGFAKMLERVAWHVRAIAAGPFEGVEIGPAGKGEAVACEGMLEEGLIESVVVMGDEDNVS